MRKRIVIATVAICVICTALILGVIFVQRDAIPPRDLTLSNYPKVFAPEAVIAIGEQTFNKSLVKKRYASFSTNFRKV